MPVGCPSGSDLNKGLKVRSLIGLQGPPATLAGGFHRVILKDLFCAPLQQRRADLVAEACRVVFISLA